MRIPRAPLHGSPCPGQWGVRGRSGCSSGTDASVLVALLWCLALLSLLVVGILHSARIDLQVGRNEVDRIQARYLALAGIEKAKALLHRDAKERSRSGVSHTGALFDAPEHFRDVALGRGAFRVFRAASAAEGGGVRYGVDDEESRLNINVASAEELARLQGMTEGIPAAVVDWRDQDHTVTPGGGELDAYAAMVPPRLPRDGPFQTVRELLMVRGMDPGRLRGDDARLNGLAGEVDEETPGDSTPPAPRSVTAGSGWAAVLTAHSGVANVSATGQDRVDLQSASESELTGVRGITAEIARAIVAHRGQNQFGSVADLLNVGPAPASGEPSAGGRPGRGATPVGQAPGAAAGGTSGPRVIDQNLLIEIADRVSVGGGLLQPGLVNINTAGVEALACLPGITRETAQALVSYRASAGFLPNVAALLQVPGLTPEVLKQVAPRVTARSETYRILAEGWTRGSGARQRVQAIVRVGLNSVETLAYREDDL